MIKKRLINRMKSKFLGGGLLFLSNISLISVGFSAWSISTVGSAEVQITVGVEDVVQEQIITIENGEYNFAIGQDGLVVDQKISKTASMVMQFNVDNVKAASYISNDGKIKATVTLSELTSTTFLTYCGSKPSSEVPSITIGDNSSASTTSITNLISFSTSNSLQTSVSLIYTITDKVTNSISEIASKFYSNLPSLAFSVTLEDVV